MDLSRPWLNSVILHRGMEVHVRLLGRPSLTKVGNGMSDTHNRTSSNRIASNIQNSKIQLESGDVGLSGLGSLGLTIEHRTGIMYGLCVTHGSMPAHTPHCPSTKTMRIPSPRIVFDLRFTASLHPNFTCMSDRLSLRSDWTAP